MKSLLTNFWKGPITSVMGLALFGLTCWAIVESKLEFIWNGAALLTVSVALTAMSDKEVKDWIKKAFNGLLNLLSKVSPVIIIVVLLASCGSIKNVNKNKEKSTVKTDSAAQTKINETVKTTTVEQIDTTLTVKGSELKGSTPLKDITPDRPLVLEDENQIVTVILDSAGKLKVTGKVKDKKVTVNFKRTTEQEKKTVTKSKVTSSKGITKKTVVKDKKVTRTGPPFWFAILFFILFMVAVIWYLVRRKILPPYLRG